MRLYISTAGLLSLELPGQTTCSYTLVFQVSTITGISKQQYGIISFCYAEVSVTSRTPVEQLKLELSSKSMLFEKSQLELTKVVGQGKGETPTGCCIINCFQIQENRGWCTEDMF